ncbi:MAG: imidazole glycerol phosphate synthase subunit HisH [Candidatus Methylacidiphilales bacterium]
MKIGLVDYGRGNLRSVAQALAQVACEPVRVSQPQEFSGCDLMVLPGVGAFGDAMGALDRQGLITPLREWLEAGRPFLGICLGFQLLFEASEESPGVAGLGWLPGRVVRFPRSVGKVPHMGWNQVEWTPAVEAVLGARRTEFFYHVHSFYPEAVGEEAACFTTYGGLRFASGVVKGGTLAVQFHPEKSQVGGLELLRAFLQWAKA